MQLWSCLPPCAWFPARAWHTAELSTCLNDWRSWLTSLLWSTADGEGVPLVASNGGDVQIQVIARSVVEKRGPLDEKMSHLGRQGDQHHLYRPKADRRAEAGPFSTIHQASPDRRSFCACEWGPPLQHICQPGMGKIQRREESGCVWSKDHGSIPLMV